MSRVLIATRSTHKASEIRRIIGATRGLDLVTLSDLDVREESEEDAIENAPTFLENAIAKAFYFARRCGLPTLADDSGLEVVALNGAPGVRTRRFALDAGQVSLTGDALDQANNQLLLERLRSVPHDERDARYVCAAAFVDAEVQRAQALGTCAGAIAFEPRGDRGFGYDPIFLLPELGVTFAQLTPEQKNVLSHRARAFRALSVLLPRSSVDPNTHDR